MNALAVTFSSLFLSVLGQTAVFEAGTLHIDDALSDVDHMADWIQTFPEESTVMVHGYACEGDRLPETTEEDLLQMAENRAIKLRQELIHRGIEGSRISTIAYGTMPGPGIWGCQATATIQN